jgi:hypothetical protein
MTQPRPVTSLLRAAALIGPSFVATVEAAASADAAAAAAVWSVWRATGQRGALAAVVLALPWARRGWWSSETALAAVSAALACRVQTAGAVQDRQLEASTQTAGRVAGRCRRRVV